MGIPEPRKADDRPTRPGREPPLSQDEERRLAGLWLQSADERALGRLVSAHLGLRWPVFIGALLVIAVWLWTYLARDRIAAAMEAHDAGSVA